MNIIKPKNLKPGDTIAIIAPSGPVCEEKICKAKDFFEKKGYKIIFGKNLFKKDRFLAGSDEDRLADLHWAFEDKSINAILCARGGYGAIRILDKINYDIIRNNPKIFCGYSDVTALSLMLLHHVGLATFSSPMFQSDFSCDEVSPVTQNSFFNLLSGKKEVYKSKTLIIDGTATGMLWGGNLSTIVSLCGTDFIPDEKFIFFTEDVAEPVYKIDKMLNQLLRAEKFRQNIAGIAFGEFTQTNDEKNYLPQTLTEFATALNVPACSGFKITHSVEKQTIPIGCTAKLDGNITLL